MIRWTAWRLHRRGLLGFGVGGFLGSVFYGAAFQQAAGTTAAAHAAFGRSVSLVARQFAFIIPLPLHAETLGGYEQYKWLAGVNLMLMTWAALAGVGIGRGDEDRGITEAWLAGGISRRRLLLARSAAFGGTLAVACLGCVLGISAVAPAVQQDPNLAGELLKALSMLAGLSTIYGIALLVAQLPTERQTATSIGVGVPVFLLVVNGIADTIPAVSWVGVFSPFHWMEQTTSAAPGGVFDFAATAGLALAAGALMAIAILVFQRRDIGDGLVSWGRHRNRVERVASTNFMLRMPFTEGLWEQRVSLSTWFSGTLALGAVMVSVTRSSADAFFSDPHLAALFTRMAPGPPYLALLGFIWFGFALLQLAAYAVVQVSRWAAQDQDGRVEMLLSAPVSRSRVIVDRALEFGTASLVIVAGGYIGVGLSLPSSGLNLDAGRLLAASALLWPFALAFGGLGLALASRWPRAAVPALAAFAVVEYFLGDLAPLFQLPGWVANLSIFHLYGNPIIGNARWAPGGWMVVVFVVGLGAAVLMAQRRDLASG